MYTTNSRTERTLVAATAVAVSMLGLTIVANAFLPSDPSVTLARGQAIIANAEKIRDAQQVVQRPVRTALVAATVH